ncbi:MAG: hypothetical protein MHPSP_001490, partial [Paramarteilia canceri]
MKCVVRLYNPMTSHELDPGQIEPVHSKYLVVDEDRLTERMNHIKRMGSHSLASPEELNKQSMPFELYNLRPLEDNSNTNVVQLLYKGSEEECQRYISSLGTDDSSGKRTGLVHKTLASLSLCTKTNSQNLVVTLIILFIFECLNKMDLNKLFKTITYCYKKLKLLLKNSLNAGSEDVAKKIMSRQFKKTRLQKKYFDSAEYFGSGGNFT